MASEIKVDTISEKTSAGGVTIDGLLIKDGNISGDVALAGTTPTFTIGDAGAEDATLLFDGNAQDFHIGLDDSADDLVIGVGSTLGTTTALAIDENAGSTFSGTVTVGVDDTGKDVKFFGASAGAYMEWDESADQLRIMGASADATTSTGKLLLATSLTDINANDEIGKIEFQAPHEAGGTDAIAVAASIKAVAQSTFSSSSNATDLIFYTGHSEAAAEKIRITSQNEIGIAGANYGSDGQVLTSGGAGAAVAWEDAGGGDNTPSWGARLSSTQSISASTLTKCALATEDWDTDSAFDTTNYKMVIPSGEGGKYLLVFGTNIGHMNDGNDVQVVPYVNGSSINRGIRYWVSNAGVGIYIMASVIYPLAAADYVELYCSWSGSTGGSPTMGNERTLLQGFKLSGV